ncbi:MAG: hypothetical protein ACE5I5_16605 [Candidatus Heimdallarchaeota archaeon]
MASKDELARAETELYELIMPGKLIGKAIVDGAARLVGIVRSVKLSVPPVRVDIIAKGMEIEFPINTTDIVAVGGIVQLKNVISEAEEIAIDDIIRLREEIKSEIHAYLKQAS